MRCGLCKSCLPPHKTRRPLPDTSAVLSCRSSQAGSAYPSIDGLNPGRRRQSRLEWPIIRSSGLPESFRLRQLGDGLCKLCGGTGHAGSLLWVSNRIDSNHCPNIADLSENGRARISEICQALVFQKSVVWTFTNGTISNDGRQIEAISSVTDLHSGGRIDDRAKLVTSYRLYLDRFC